MGEEKDEHSAQERRDLKPLLARACAHGSRSYGRNFQASGFPENLWRGHSLDRHEQCSPSFIRACYRSEPFGPAGVTCVYVSERCDVFARARAWIERRGAARPFSPMRSCYKQRG